MFPSAISSNVTLSHTFSDILGLKLIVCQRSKLECECVHFIYFPPFPPPTAQEGKIVSRFCQVMEVGIIVGIHFCEYFASADFLNSNFLLWLEA